MSRRRSWVTMVMIQGYQEKQVREAIARSQSANPAEREHAIENQHSSDNVTAEELAQARSYAMEMEWSPEDAIFVVSFPDVPGVRTHGTTREDAAAMGDDAIITWLTAMIDAGRPVPPPSPYSDGVTVDPPPGYDANRIREIRRSSNVSQRIFADLLNVSLATVRSWEQGARTPDGAATRLLSIAERRPEIILEAAASRGKQPERLARTD
ncbi:MAG: type II toxin-antitoxin system HicB family antitoxin [Chloroflexota bacterium]|nr:type II toxin-antitoxin system HicB family antitoxin [Chloroflexota bacterium]